MANLCGNSPSKIRGFVSVLESHIHAWEEAIKLFLLSYSFGVLYEAFLLEFNLTVIMHYLKDSGRIIYPCKISIFSRGKLLM